MNRTLTVATACALLGVGFVVGSLSPLQVAQAQVGASGAWPAAAAAPNDASGGTHFYAIDTGSRTLIACRMQHSGKPVCTRDPLP
jgi:hypothetical protein